jgi:hypothetical protein
VQGKGEGGQRKGNDLNLANYRAVRLFLFLPGKGPKSMKRIYVPTRSTLDWKDLLAQPNLHWKPKFSAMSIAQSWEAANGALPPEIAALLAGSSDRTLHEPQLLLAIPEYQVDLPGGTRPTQTDVFALVRTHGGITALAVEGKVDETFGPNVDQKRAEGAEDRLKHLHELLELNPQHSGALRYQLLHRTAAAIILAQQFRAEAGVMVVQSFSPKNRWFDDFQHFGQAIGVQPEKGCLADVGTRGGIRLYIGWAIGDQRFRKDLSGDSTKATCGEDGK